MRMAVRYACDMLLSMLPALPIYLPARFLWLRRRGGPVSRRRELLLLCFVLFCVGLASQTVLPALYADPSGRLHAVTVFSQGWQGRRWGFNFVPFRTIGQYFTRGNGGLFVLNILGNLGVFVPIGLLMPLLWPRWRKWYKMALWGMGISCTIECLQVFTLRSVDVDDVILHTLGALAGYGLFLLLRRCRR